MHRILLPCFLAILTATASAAGEGTPSQAACDRAKLPGRAYIECLESSLRDADKAMTAAFEHALSSVETRPDLTSAQRTRWKNVLEEAQGLFIRFRNFDCQNVAPYEGSGGRIGAFEKRLACLIDKNTARLEELTGRYGNQ